MFERTQAQPLRESAERQGLAGGHELGEDAELGQREAEGLERLVELRLQRV